MKTVAAYVLLGAVAAACLAPGGTLFKATVTQPDGSYPLEVVLGDHTGKVIAVGSALGDGAGGVLPRTQQDPNNPNAVIVTWATGACDDVHMLFQATDTRYRLDVIAHERIGLGCTAQLLFRALRIRFSEPISPDSITARGGR
jgi:hypothetical protein